MIRVFKFDPFCGNDMPPAQSGRWWTSWYESPLEEPDKIPDDLRRELASVLGRHLSKLIARKGITERQIEKDFDAHLNQTPATPLGNLMPLQSKGDVFRSPHPSVTARIQITRP